MEKQFYFKLNPYCFVVLGGNQPSICDMQREMYRYISDDLACILTQLKHQTVGEIQTLLPDCEPEEVSAYFRFLLRNGFGYFSAECEDGNAAA